MYLLQQDQLLNFDPSNDPWCPLPDANQHLPLFQQKAMHQLNLPCSQAIDALASTNHEFIFQKQFDFFHNCEASQDQSSDQNFQESLFGKIIDYDSHSQPSYEVNYEEKGIKSIKKAGRPKKALVNRKAEDSEQYLGQSEEEQLSPTKLNKNKRRNRKNSSITFKNKNMLHFLFHKINQFINFEEHREFGIPPKINVTRQNLEEILHNEAYRPMFAHMFRSKYLTHRIFLCKMSSQMSRMNNKRSVNIFQKRCLKSLLEIN